MTFDVTVVTLTFKRLSGPYLRNCKVKEVGTGMGHWSGSVGLLNHGGMFNLHSIKVFLPAIFDTFFYHKDIWIAATD